MKKYLVHTVLFMVTAISLMSSCSPTPQVPDVRIDIIHSWAETVIEPSFEELYNASESMVASADVLCSNLNEQTLSDARADWQLARQRWKHLEPFYFGPHKAAPARLGQTMDFWPIRENKIADLIASDFELSGEGMQRQGAVVRGFPVLEFLLYAGEPDTLTSLRQSDRRCQMLVAVAMDLEFLSGALRDAWLAPGTGFINALLQPETGEFMNPKGAFSEVVNRMGFAIENIRRDRLGAPLGDKSGGSLQPDSVESRYSGRSVPDILDVLTSIETLVHGAEAPQSLGLVDHPRVQGRPEMIQRFDDAVARSRAALNAIPMPLREHLMETELVRSAFDALGDVQRSIQADFINVLGLSLSFNDADGD